MLAAIDRERRHVSRFLSFFDKENPEQFLIVSRIIFSDSKYVIKKTAATVFTQSHGIIIGIAAWSFQTFFSQGQAKASNSYYQLKLVK